MMPALSEAFILREIDQLRRQGWRVQVASVNPPDRPPERMTDAEAREARDAYCLKRHGVAGALLAHLWALLSSPAGWLRGLAAAVALAGTDARRLGLWFAYFTEALMVRRWMRAHDIGHLHVHFGGAACSVALLLARSFGTPYSVTIHGPDEFYDAKGQRLREKVAAAAFVVCISDFARSQLMLVSDPSHWDRIEVGRLGVDPGRFAPAVHGARDALEILCVGRLVPAKGQHVLLDAVARLRSERGAVNLVLVGAGPDEASLRAHVERLGIAASVEFAGGVTQDRIGEYYRRADCFALASFAEGVPVVLMEAMASGLPCVSTRITGIPELIRDGIDGFLVAPGDAHALAEALGRLADAPTLRQRLGANARAHVVAHYNLAQNTAKLASIFARRLGPVETQPATLVLSGAAR